MRKRTRRTSKPLLKCQLDGLSQALQSGALAFLPLVDMVSVLNTCATLRFDAQLPFLGLAATEIGSHLLRHCTSDWMSARPSFLQVAALLSKVQCGEHTASASTHTTDVQRLTKQLDMLDGRRGQGTAMLAAIEMMQQRILPLCYQDHELNRYGDICTARPVLVPLPMGLKDKENGYKFTQNDIKTALNDALDGIGDDFMATPQQATHVSDFGAHWESIQVVASTTTSGGGGRLRSSSRYSTAAAAAAIDTTVHCQLCDAMQQAIKTYRKDAKAALKRFTQVLKDKKEHWKHHDALDAEEIHQKASELKAKFFPEDCFPDVNFADGPADAILADICESSKFPMDPFAGMAMGFDKFDDDVFNALREECVSLCGSLFQPLKKVLLDECPLIGRRVFRTWMGDDDGSVKGELVAGVTSSGFLIGVYVITQRVE